MPLPVTLKVGQSLKIDLLIEKASKELSISMMGISIDYTQTNGIISTTKLHCVSIMENISTKLTPLCSPSSPISNRPNSISLAASLLTLAYQAMLFISQLMCTARPTEESVTCINKLVFCNNCASKMEFGLFDRKRMTNTAVSVCGYRHHICNAGRFFFLQNDTI